VQLKQKTVYFSMELKLQKKKRKGRTKGACFEFCNYICVCVYIYIYFHNKLIFICDHMDKANGPSKDGSCLMG
jgi:hypothetical protein